MKKFTAIFLLLAMILSVVACADSVGSGEDSSGIPSGSSSESSSESVPSGDEIDEMPFLDSLIADRSKVTDGIGEFDANGASVQIDAPNGPGGTNYDADWLLEAAITSDPMNNALYQRIVDIEERFKIDIEFNFLGNENYNTMRITAVQSGLGDVDIISIHPAYIGLALEGIFDDLNTFDYLDFDRQWWFGDTIDDFSLNGTSLIAFGSCTASSIFSGTEVCYFNKELCEDNGIEDLYQVVRENRWTYDYVYKLARDYIAELDGVEGNTEGDQYGFKYNTYLIRIFWNMGGEYCVIDDSTGVPTINLQSDKNEELFTKCKELLTLYDKDIGDDWFEKGKILLTATNLAYIEQSRNKIDFEVGILPMFKLNEQQDKYIASGYLSGVGITIDATDGNLAALVLEAMAYYGWRDVVPKYYETIIKFKHSSDQQNAEMLDLMYSNMTYDAIWMYHKDTVYELANFITSNKAFASFIKKPAQLAEKYISFAVKDYQNIIDRLKK